MALLVFLAGATGTRLIAANFGTFAAMIAFVLKIRFDWGTVSSRLNSRTTYFEADQTGQRAQKDKGVST